MSNELKKAEQIAHAYDGLGAPMSDPMLAATRESQGQPADAEPRSPFNTGRSSPGSQNALREASFATEEATMGLPEAPAGAVKAAAPSEEPDEVTEDEIRSRAKDIIRRNGWLEQKAPPQLHSIIELMVSLGIDVLKNRPASCGYPGCGCDFDAVCNAAFAAPAVAAVAVSVKPFDLSAENIETLRSNGLKPEEIAGDQRVQAKRVGELLHWFVRLARDSANPKWTRSHAFELAYYLATTDDRAPFDIGAVEQAAWLKGLQEPAEVRDMAVRHGWIPAPSSIIPATKPVADTGVASMPATGPYVDRIIRIFSDRPDDDASAVVLLDYARAALSLAKREPQG
jgi:hypothetical protein